MNFQPSISVNVIELTVFLWESPIKVGDTLVYVEGASYYVEDVMFEEREHVTYALRSIVPQEDARTNFWDACYISVGRHCPLPAEVTVFKGVN